MSAELPERPLPNSYWVLPGRFLAGEHPGRGTSTSLETRERLRQLMDIGIDCFLDLTMPDELEPYEKELPAGVEYTRLPIRDHSIPAQRTHMVEILAHITRLLRAGRRIYLHCHAGIGRTGMVTGCFLAERGGTGDEALDELNRLWRHCDRSRTWSFVPETEEQIEFVRQWKSKAPRDPAAQLGAIPLRTPQRIGFAATADRGLRDRFHGALLGLAVGDALAAAPPGQELGAWTDDTAMALCLAESLLECEGFDVHDQVQRYSRWQSEGYLSATGQCIGITPNTARALAAAQWRRQVFAGSHDPKQLDPEVLSRVAPAVMFGFSSPQEALRMACDAARITCQAPMAVETCQLFAALVYQALMGLPKSRVLQPGSDLLDPTTLRPKVAALLDRSTTASAERRPQAGSTVIKVLSTALWAFETTENFREGALRAASPGKHADAIAAAYGQLAGAHYGAQAIPVAWRNGLAGKDSIAGFAERLFAHAQAHTIK